MNSRTRPIHIQPIDCTRNWFLTHLKRTWKHVECVDYVESWDYYQVAGLLVLVWHLIINGTRGSVEFSGYKLILIVFYWRDALCACTCSNRDGIKHLINMLFIENRDTNNPCNNSICKVKFNISWKYRWIFSYISESVDESVRGSTKRMKWSWICRC